MEALGRLRGRSTGDRRDQQIAGLERCLERGEAGLPKARKVVEVQGDVSAFLGEEAEGRNRVSGYRAMIEQTVENVTP